MIYGAFVNGPEFSFAAHYHEDLLGFTKYPQWPIYGDLIKFI